MYTLIAILVLISPVVAIIYGVKMYKAYKKGEQLVKRDKIIAIASFVFAAIFVCFIVDTSGD